MTLLEQPSHLPHLRKLTKKLCLQEVEHKTTLSQVIVIITTAHKKNGSATKKEHQQIIQQLYELIK